MPGPITSATEALKSGNRIVVWGIVAVVGILLVGGLLLFLSLPDANAFNARVERIFVENDALTTTEQLKLLEILAQSGTTFAEVLTSYRMVIFVLMVFATGLMIASLVFLVTIIALNRQMGEIEKQGIQVNSLLISRDQNTVYINNMEFSLTPAAIETLAVLAEARMDEDVLSGAEIEGVISGRPSADCDEAAGATRIKRLRDSLGNQLVSELLVKNIARKGYMLAIDKSVIRMI
ncbi:winged helix-turn-helix domain-containing protein [Frigidibacter sp. ROC022]|uniref:winged helix-turn-helix domain-containing protein n=1 Tax=Frigidibacter sp. ROC022 TaxID=2971796 RepID=UPI00215B2CF8|nr:hypothetical protein [Frigidibacter sp. ROC022]